MELGNTSSNLLSFNLFHVVSKIFQFLFISSGVFCLERLWGKLKFHVWWNAYPWEISTRTTGRRRSNFDFSIYFYKRNSFGFFSHLFLLLNHHPPRANQHKVGRNCKDRTKRWDDYKYDAIVSRFTFIPPCPRLKRCNIFHYFMCTP